MENRGFDQTIDADGWPTDLRHSVYRILDSGGLGILFGGCAFSISVVCELLEGDSCPARFATKVIGFVRALGVSSIRASSIRAIAIMTNAVETNRILSSPLKLMYDTSFSSRLVLRASPPDLY